jgi:hypothetical protein
LVAKVLFVGKMETKYFEHLCLLIDGILILYLPFNETESKIAKEKVFVRVDINLTVVAFKLGKQIPKSIWSTTLPNQ